MRTITTTLYTVAELREQFPRGYERAVQDFAERESTWYDPSEVWDSLQALDKHVGYDRDNRYPAWGDGLGGASELTGKRAWAWLENHVLADLRIPWSGSRRWDVARYGWAYRPGLVEPCPFTGVAYDEDLLDDLRDSIRRGASVGNAMHMLAGRAERIADEERDYMSSQERFLEHADNEELEFDAEGRII